MAFGMIKIDALCGFDTVGCVTFYQLCTHQQREPEHVAQQGYKHEEGRAGGGADTGREWVTFYPKNGNSS